MAKRTLGELEDELKARDRRIEELRQEIDEQRELISKLRENAEDYDGVIERWCEAFDMEQTESGGWTWKPFWDTWSAQLADHNELIRRWNKYLPLINGRTQPVGRPLAASEAQQAEVIKLHKRGMSLRAIVDETSLGFQIVRIIIAKGNGTDRSTRRHRKDLERIDNRAQALPWQRQKRTGDALPKRAQRVVEEGRELIKEAKGLGR